MRNAMRVVLISALGAALAAGVSAQQSPPANLAKVNFRLN